VPLFYRFVRAWTLYDNNIQYSVEKTIRCEYPLFSDFAVHTEITSRIYDTPSRLEILIATPIRDNQKHTAVCNTHELNPRRTLSLCILKLPRTVVYLPIFFKSLTDNSDRVVHFLTETIVLHQIYIHYNLCAYL